MYSIGNRERNSEQGSKRPESSWLLRYVSFKNENKKVGQTHIFSNARERVRALLKPLFKAREGSRALDPFR